MNAPNTLLRALGCYFFATSFSSVVCLLCFYINSRYDLISGVIAYGCGFFYQYTNISVYCGFIEQSSIGWPRVQFNSLKSQFTSLFIKVEKI